MNEANQNNLIGDELLVAVFSKFEPGENLKFRDELNVISAFYHASTKVKYKNLFQNYTFDSDGVFPYSREISEGLSNLHQSALIRKLNPTFSYYQLSAGIRIRYKKYIENNLDDPTKELIEELSAEIKQELLEPVM